RTGAVTPEAAIEQTERRNDHPGGMVVLPGQRLLHLSRGIAQCILAADERDLGEMIARRAVEIHVPLSAERMSSRRAGEAVFHAKLFRPLAGMGIVGNAGFLRRMSLRP